jgi:hypothetical protein
MRSLAVLTVGVILGAAANAQEVPHFTFNVGGGFTQPVGNTARITDTGWNVKAGAGFNANAFLGGIFEFQYNRMDLNGGTLSALGVPGGDVQVWSLTFNPTVHLIPRGPVDIYLIGGGGLYHELNEMTAPSITPITGFDPFFGFFTTAVRTRTVLSDYEVYKPGVNAGAGVSFGTRWHAKVFAEARYHRVIFGDHHTDFIPVSFGLRF